jgi:hypothetical protein
MDGRQHDAVATGDAAGICPRSLVRVFARSLVSMTDVEAAA